jgi:hypothetical protein
MLEPRALPKSFSRRAVEVWTRLRGPSGWKQAASTSGSSDEFIGAYRHLPKSGIGQQYDQVASRRQDDLGGTEKACEFPRPGLAGSAGIDALIRRT